MSLRSSISEEFKRAPVATISGLASAVIAGLSFVLAWSQSGSSASVLGSGTGTTGSYAEDFSLRNAALVVAYFISVTVAVALLLRAIARKHDFAAFVVSIPLLALANFSAILIIYLSPPRPYSAQLFASAHDLVFYASAAIVIAFCGREVLVSLASTYPKKKTNEKPTDTGGDGVGILLMALIVLGVWSWLVFAGQTRLTRTLLPEITHPVDTKSASQSR